MTKNLKPFLMGAIVGALIVSVSRDERIVRAQTPAPPRKPIMMTRIYVGPDGLSRAEEVAIPLNANGQPEFKTTAAQFSRRPPAPASDWHTGPRRQLVITLAGRAELELGDGTKVQASAGHINLIEDTTGKGHITHNLGPDDRIVLTLPLIDAAEGAKPGGSR